MQEQPSSLDRKTYHMQSPTTAQLFKSNQHFTTSIDLEQDQKTSVVV